MQGDAVGDGHPDESAEGRRSASEAGVEVFGHYELREIIGRGGMGEVWRAHDRRQQRDVALKRITVAAAHDTQFRGRFLREARVTASLGSLHVIPLHDFGEIDGRLYLVMRLVDSGDLESRLRSHPRGLHPRHAVMIAGQIADALDAAHARDLVHRDVKPANVLLARSRGEDFAYLVDFGIAKAADATGLTGTGTTIGTTAYMAPELFAGHEATPAADVYALGCVLFEALTGHRAFPAATVPALIQSHLYGPIPHTGRPDLVGYEPVLARALAKEPRERFRSAGELAAAAADVTPPTPEPPTWGGPPPRWGPASGPHDLGPWRPNAPWPYGPGHPAPTAVQPPPERRWRRVRRPVLLLAVLLLVVGVGVAALVLTRTPTAPSAAAPVAPRPAHADRIAARALPVALNAAEGIALSADGTKAWVAANGSNQAPSRELRVIDLPTGRDDGAIPTGRAPVAVVASADRRLLYVTVQSESQALDSVAVVDVATGRPVGSVPTGERPWHGTLTPDGRALLVADLGYEGPPPSPNPSVTVIDTGTRTAVRTIPLPRAPWDVAVAPDGRTAFASLYGTSDDGSDTLAVIDVVSGTVRGEVPVGFFPAGLTVSPDGRTLYVAQMGSDNDRVGSIAVVDTAAASVRTVIRGDRISPVALAVSPDGSRAVAVTGGNDSWGVPASVAVIDTASNTITASVPVGRGAARAVFSPDGRQAYVTTATGLWVVDVP